MTTMSAESEETNPASTCRSKAVSAATATPRAVGQRCTSTSDQRRRPGGCCTRGDSPLAVAWPPTPPATCSSVMASSPILGHGPTSVEPHGLFRSSTSTILYPRRVCQEEAAVATRRRGRRVLWGTGEADGRGRRRLLHGPAPGACCSGLGGARPLL